MGIRIAAVSRKKLKVNIYVFLKNYVTIIIEQNDPLDKYMIKIVFFNRFCIYRFQIKSKPEKWW